MEQILDGQALVVVEHGKPLKQRMKKSRVDEGDILEAARQQHGLERMEQVKFAVLEKNGQINIIPQEQKK